MASRPPNSAGGASAVGRTSTAGSRRTTAGSKGGGGKGKRIGKREAVTVTARLVIDMDKILKLEEWIQHEFLRYQGRVRDENVLYALSRDGASNETFHQQCDGFGPTVTFVILGNKRVFGGYTTVPWTMDNQPRVDREAFLFSLSDGDARDALKLPQTANAGFAVNHYRDRGPLFGVGAGADLGLNLDEEKLAMCRSSVGRTYEIPRASAKDPVISDTFLAGKLDNWDIEDVVVYYCGEREGEKIPPPTGSTSAVTTTPSVSRQGSMAGSSAPVARQGSMARGMEAGISSVSHMESLREDGGTP